MARKTLSIDLKITRSYLLYCSVWLQLLGAESCCASGKATQNQACTKYQRWSTTVTLKEGLGQIYFFYVSNSLLCGKISQKKCSFCSQVWTSTKSVSLNSQSLHLGSKHPSSVWYGSILLDSRKNLDKIFSMNHLNLRKDFCLISYFQLFFSSLLFKPRIRSERLMSFPLQY